MRVFPGDHFYLVPDAAELVEDVIARITDGQAPVSEELSTIRLAQC